MTMPSLRLLQRLEPALVYGPCPLLQKPLGKHFLFAGSGNLRQPGVTEVAVSHRRHTWGIWKVAVVSRGRLVRRRFFRRCRDFQTPYLLCDCNLLWLLRWIKERNIVVKNTKCSFPQSLQGQLITSVRLEFLTCGRHSGWESPGTSQFYSIPIQKAMIQLVAIDQESQSITIPADNYIFKACIVPQIKVFSATEWGHKSHQKLPWALTEVSKTMLSVLWSLRTSLLSILPETNISCHREFSNY